MAAPSTHDFHERGELGFATQQRWVWLLRGRLVFPVASPAPSRLLSGARRKGKEGKGRGGPIASGRGRERGCDDIDLIRRRRAERRRGQRAHTHPCRDAGVGNPQIPNLATANARPAVGDHCIWALQPILRDRGISISLSASKVRKYPHSGDGFRCIVYHAVSGNESSSMPSPLACIPHRFRFILTRHRIR